VLGESQSGNMQEVGFQLYNDMLAEAVRALKSGKEPDLLSPTGAFGGGVDIKLHAPALLPDAYCGDVQTRLSLYKRLASAERPETLDSLLEEVTDRFGKLPPQGQTLFDTHRLRLLARSYGVLKVDANPKVMNVTFKPNPPVDPMRIIELVQKNRAVKLAGNDRLRIDREIAEPRERAQYVRDLLRSLGPPRVEA
jgi:transcription-repair coupling factor (superfamily II helicase)